MQSASYDLSERLLDYAVQIIKIFEELPNTTAGRRIGDQLLRSGTSVGANYQEAQAAESKADFSHKLQISLKELRKSLFSLRLIAKSELLPPDRLSEIIDETIQLRAIFSKAITTAKSKSKTTSTH